MINKNVSCKQLNVVVFFQGIDNRTLIVHEATNNQDAEFARRFNQVLYGDDDSNNSQHREEQTPPAITGTHDLNRTGQQLPTADNIRQQQQGPTPPATRTQNQVARTAAQQQPPPPQRTVQIVARRRPENQVNK